MGNYVLLFMGVAAVFALVSLIHVVVSLIREFRDEEDEYEL